MLNNEMVGLGKKRSVIREIFEYGNQRAKVVGKENIFDFSIGNPNVPAPDSVARAIEEIAQMDPVAVHGYTSAQGAEGVRQAMADDLNRRFGTDYGAHNFYMTCGAAASLTICLKALTASPEDEFLIFAPYFPEYQVFIQNGAGAKCVVIPAQIEDFQINFPVLEKSITPHTKGVLVNSPNNPSGVVYSNETMQKLADLLEEKSAEYGHPIYLISDEPYREIIYDGQAVPFIAPMYRNTLVCYSYSKSLSMPGERIGYILVPDSVEAFEDVYAAICGAGRVLGYVCAPALFQMVAAKCAGQTADLSVYETNRKLLLDGLRSFGYTCVAPGGAFYLFPRTLEPDAATFCECAKKYDLLLVPGDGFGVPGHMRVSYCVQTETIQRALPLFEKLAREYHAI
ncbi:MAG: pyridoxal phosphate-dependent aminotransferase [Oscillospiraceae bacterium]|nr:pyridoxal phosphate-dependent aminotransferase [Oscillospiraceae bacterium]